MEAVSIFNMKKDDYLDQIKSPKWQKRRLDILNRDDFTCQMCGSKDKTLHVHHTIYIPKRKIWEYSDKQLITLCEDCYNKEHFEYAEFVNQIITNMRYYGFTNKEIMFYIGNYSCGIEAEPDDSLIQIYNELHPDECGVFERLIKRRTDIGMDEIP